MKKRDFYVIGIVDIVVSSREGEMISTMKTVLKSIISEIEIPPISPEPITRLHHQKHGYFG